jgi:hypothetical protein
MWFRRIDYSYFHTVWKKWSAWFSWKRSLSPPVVDPARQYIHTRYTQFLSFKQIPREVANANIDPVIYQKSAFLGILADPDNDLEKVWKKRILIENTPRGNIYMYYDIFKQGFAYYSDTAGIPYRMLNAVASRYVRVFCCLDFFLDLPENEPSPLVPVFIEDDEQEKKKKQGKMDALKIDMNNAPFAKFKTYGKDKEVAAAGRTVSTSWTWKGLWQWLLRKMVGWGAPPPVVAPVGAGAGVPPPVKKDKIVNKFINLGYTKNFHPLIIPKIERSTVAGFSTKYDAMFSKVQAISYKDYKQSALAALSVGQS